jgi:tetraacyldisaccharide 4'-kinase
VNLLETLLWPLALPYGAAVRLRARAYRSGLLRSRRLDGTVISVGNLTLGGTGKTPMVLWIAEHLVARGERTGILTRGYRGRRSGGDLASDEARLLEARLGRGVAVGVGADRWKRGRELASRGVEWFILDDGFQHFELARDVDIVLIDATNPFGGGHLLPAGALREPKSALARADLVVITRASHAPGVEAIIRHHSRAPIFYARAKLESVRVWRGAYPGTEDPSAGTRRFFAFCGIGNPSAFLADLGAWALPVAGHRFFRDHHRYSQKDLDRVETCARRAGADALLATEKDLFNLAGVELPSMPLCYCRSSLEVDRADQFWQAIGRDR